MNEQPIEQQPVNADEEKVRKVRQAVEADLLKLPGVVGVDVGYKIVKGQKTAQLAIRVYVSKKQGVARELAIPKEIQGVPTDVIERRYVLH
jgi:bacillopeptidase F (M6 metalloprotease family)